MERQTSVCPGVLVLAIALLPAWLQHGTGHELQLEEMFSSAELLNVWIFPSLPCLALLFLPAPMETCCAAFFTAGLSFRKSGLGSWPCHSLPLWQGASLGPQGA